MIEKKSMMKKMSVIFIALMVILGACQQGMRSAKEVDQSYDPYRAEVLEVIQTTSYTYLRVEKGGQEEWIAINRQEMLPGEVVYYEGGLQMNNFESPELGRTFETVYFVSDISKESLNTADPHAGMEMDGQPQRPVIDRLDIQVDKAEGGVTIADIYANPGEYAGQTVRVRGQVTKVNAGIMDRNWIHIQDGTAHGENFDLTITTNDEPQVGDVITYSGVLNLEVDFGYGYYYDVIVEEAVPLNLH